MIWSIWFCSKQKQLVCRETETSAMLNKDEAALQEHSAKPTSLQSTCSAQIETLIRSKHVRQNINNYKKLTKHSSYSE